MELFRKGVIAIYNTIDYHQYKRAISLCNQLLASYRDNPLLLALKALSLYCDGQKSEGLLLCKRVQLSKPTDFGTLRALAEILQAEKKFEDLNSLYQTAWEKSPKDEELGNQYFMMLVGQKDFANMQKISIDLNKKFPKRSYQFWSITSILLRAQFTDQKQANLLYYPLAERMLTKLIYENDNTNEGGKVDNFEEFYLYYRVLKSQNKLDKIEELLNSSISKSSFIEPHILNLKLETYEELGYWDKIYKLGVDNLPKDKDSWNIYLPFIKAVVDLVKKEAKDSNGELITIENTQKFFETLESSKSEGGAIKLKRGPYLAQLELAKSANLPELTKLIEKYFTIFSSKPSCYDDLVPYLSHLAENSELDWIKSWCKTITEEVNIKLISDSTSSAEKIKLTQTLVTIRKIERGSNKFNLAEVNEAEWDEIIKSLVKEYQLVLPLGEKLLSTDKQYGDDLLLLAIHYGLDIYYYNHNKSQTSTSSTLPTLVYFLEFGISKSPSNYHFKFLLTRLYQLLGSFTSYGPHLKALDIKQIQLDTLAHTWIHHTNYLGHWKQIEKEDSQCNYIYRSNEKETIDMIRLCFKNGTYSKIPEFLKFYTRLEGSLQSRLNFIELVKGSWINAISSKWQKSNTEFFQNLNDWFEETNLTKLDELSDNRDFGIYPDFEFNNKSQGTGKWNVETSTSVFPIRDNNWLKLQAKLVLILNNWYLEYTSNNSAGIKFDEKLLTEIEELKSQLDTLKSSKILSTDLLSASLITILPEYTKSEANLQELNDKLKSLLQAQFDALNKLSSIEFGRKLYLIYNLLDALGCILAFIQFSQPSSAGGKAGKGAGSKSGPKPSTPAWINSIKKLVDNYSQKLVDSVNQMKLPNLTEANIETEVNKYGLKVDKKLIDQFYQILNQNWKSSQKTYQVKVKNLI